MINRINIYQKVKAAAFMLLALGCVAFLSASATLAQTKSKGTEVVSSYLRDPDGNIMRDKDGKPYSVRRIDVNSGSSAFRPQTPEEELSSVYRYEVNNIKKNIEEKGVIVGGLQSLFETTGDVAGFALDAGHRATKKAFDKADAVLDKVNEIPIVGAVSKYLVRPLVNAARFISDVGFGAAKAVVNTVLPGSNVQCRQEKMDRIYKSNCYPCIVIKSLISAFLNGVNVLNGLMVDAGKKILVLGFLLWIAFYILQQLSSLKNLEPADMVNTLLIMAFKVLGAWLVISAGFDIFIQFVVIPFLGWGIDFGTYVLTAATSATGLDISGSQVPDAYMVTDASITSNGGRSLIPPHLFNNLMTYVAAVDGTVTSHMKLGHMITCHSIHKGAFNILSISIPNIWIWLCGAAIWCMGFMITFAVLFYLIDISFKLGIAVIAFPIVMALWPFSITTDKLTAVFKMIINAAGIFIFLAVTTAMGLVLIDVALSAAHIAETGGNAEDILRPIDEIPGIATIYDAVERGNSDYISETFALFSSTFLILVFAYLYAFKTIRSTNSDYVNQFFPDSVLGKQTPMHAMLTGAVSVVSGQAKNLAKVSKDIAKDQGQKIANKVKNRFKNLENGDTVPTNKPDNNRSGSNTVQSMTNMQSRDEQAHREQNSNSNSSDKKSSGNDAEATALENATNAAGEATSQAGEAIRQSTDAAANAQRTAGNAVGGALDSTVVGAPAGVTVQASTQATAAATQASGNVMEKTLKATGKIIKKAGKIAAKTMKVANKAAKKASKVAKATVSRVDSLQNSGTIQKPSNKKEENND